MIRCDTIDQIVVAGLEEVGSWESERRRNGKNGHERWGFGWLAHRQIDDAGTKGERLVTCLLTYRRQGGESEAETDMRGWVICSASQPQLISIVDIQKVRIEGVSKKLECMLLLFFFFIEDISGLKIIHQPPDKYVEVCRRRFAYQS